VSAPLQILFGAWPMLFGATLAMVALAVGLPIVIAALLERAERLAAWSYERLRGERARDRRGRVAPAPRESGEEVSSPSPSRGG
jgi:hypothetical protein